MLKFGIRDKYVKMTNFEDMSTKKKENEPGSEDFETLKLKKRVNRTGETTPNGRDEGYSFLRLCRYC